MATRVLLTIDTELVWRHHAAGLAWEENFARSYDAAGVGIPYQLRMLAEHGLKACFFVDPMPALVHGLDPVRRMIEPILAAGQEIQLHVHPFWARIAEGDRKANTRELNDYTAAEQLRLIGRARELLIAAGAPEPIAFRAGSYAADAATLRALRELGIRYDSSHNGSHHPRPSAVALPREQLAPVAIDGIVEVPVGQIEESSGCLRHLQLCAVSFPELRAAILHASRRKHPLVTIVSHSFELATRDGLRSNGVVSRRFVRLCRFLASRRETLPTAGFGGLADLPLGAQASPARGRSLRRLGRVTGQAWGQARYEQPSVGLSVAASTAAAMAAAVASAE